MPRDIIILGRLIHYCSELPTLQYVPHSRSETAVNWHAIVLLYIWIHHGFRARIMYRIHITNNFEGANLTYSNVAKSVGCGQSCADSNVKDTSTIPSWITDYTFMEW